MQMHPVPRTRDTFFCDFEMTEFLLHFEILHNHSLCIHIILYVYFDSISSPEYLMSSLSYKSEKAKNHLTT